MTCAAVAAACLAVKASILWGELMALRAMCFLSIARSHSDSTQCVLARGNWLEMSGIRAVTDAA